MKKKDVVSYLFLLDNSGSMYGEKICALNLAVSNLIMGLKRLPIEDDLKIAIITFGGEAFLHTPFTSIKEINFQNISAHGGSFLTEALVLADSILTEKTCIVLISDGLPNNGGFKRQLTNIDLKASVYAVGIGFDADYDMLEHFTKNKEHIIPAFDMENMAELLWHL